MKLKYIFMPENGTQICFTIELVWQCNKNTNVFTGNTNVFTEKIALNNEREGKRDSLGCSPLFSPDGKKNEKVQFFFYLKFHQTPASA